MAYNIIKGRAGSVVGKNTDQEVGGKKTFLNPVSAYGFYDLQKDSPVATVADLPITQVRGKRYGGIVTFSSQGHLRVDDEMRVSEGVLYAPHIQAGTLKGSAKALKEIPSNEFISPIPASQVSHGVGLRSVGPTLQVNPHMGIKVEEEGVSVDLYHAGGLSYHRKSLTIDPRRSPSIKDNGQNLHDADVLLVQDSSRGDLRHTTLQNLYEGYLKTKVPHAEGGKYNVQFRGNTGFAASPNFCFEPTSNILAINGQINTNTMLVLGDVQIAGTTRMQGAVVANVTTITSKTYEVHDDDYTILADTTKNTVLVTLPPAENHAGRIFNIKKINSNPYKLNSNKLTIKAVGGKIDSAKEIVMKINNSCRVFQSDGRTWWNIGSRGS